MLLLFRVIADATPMLLRHFDALMMSLFTPPPAPLMMPPSIDVFRHFAELPR